MCDYRKSYMFVACACMRLHLLRYVSAVCDCCVCDINVKGEKARQLLACLQEHRGAICSVKLSQTVVSVREEEGERGRQI